MSSKYTVTRDPIVKGLQYRDYPDGRRMYYVYYNYDKRERRPKIGDGRYLSLSEARTRAKAILGDVARGIDPANKPAKVLTIDELFDEVWLKHWNTDRYHVSGWAQEVFRNYTKHVRPAFAHVSLPKLTRGLIYKWHLEFKDNPYAGNRSLEVLSTMLTHAVLAEYVPANPCIGIPAHPEAERDRYATAAELAKLGPALTRELTPQTAFFLIMAYTGARPSAIMRADWDSLDVIDGCGIVRFFGKSSGDTGHDEAILLPPQALAILEKVKPCKAMPRYAWARIQAEVGAPDLWARDLRRTFATVARSAGIPMSIISGLLGHADGTRTTSIYAKLTEKASIEAVKRIGQEMELCLTSNRTS